MRSVQGDLIQLALKGEFDVILHGCNCQCVMGKGIALTIKQQFPQAYAADRATMPGSRDKLGTISSAAIDVGDHRLIVVNGYTQFDYRGKGVKADYEAIRGVMQTVRLRFSGSRIGYPKIGAGMAGGDWQRIAAIIDEELEGEDHTLVEFAP
jgi:O-acetyl-ADP-ribose deacetylase (regulator of RNase III)